MSMSMGKCKRQETTQATVKRDRLHEQVLALRASIAALRQTVDERVRLAER